MEDVCVYEGNLWRLGKRDSSPFLHWWMTMVYGSLGYDASRKI